MDVSDIGDQNAAQGIKTVFAVRSQLKNTLRYLNCFERGVPFRFNNQALYKFHEIQNK